MSVLISLLLLLKLLLLLEVDIYKTDCAIGNTSRYTKGIATDGRPKFADLFFDNRRIDYMISQKSEDCQSDLDQNLLPTCDCNYVKGFGNIYSCSGDNMTILPYPPQHDSSNTIRIYNLTGGTNVSEIKSHQFKGMKIREMRIQLMEKFTIEEEAFQGLLNLEILKITDNNLGKIGNPKLIFAGLDNLTTLDLSYNQLTGWETIENGTYDSIIFTPILPKLRLLDLSGNPINSLQNDSFLWLEGSKLEYLILHDCGNPLKVHPDALLPVSGTLHTIDLSSAQIGSDALLALTSVCSSTLKTLSLSKIGMTTIPYGALEQLNSSLQHLSLSGNMFRNLGEEEFGFEPRSSSSQVSQTDVFPHMPTLEELDLRNCLIYYIRDRVFDSLPNLKTLLLSTNQLVSFSNLVSLKFSSLTYLDVSHNPISLGNDNLTFYPALEILDLSYTIGEHLTRSTFRSENSSLKQLSLCYSNIKNIKNEAFSNLGTLELLDLSGNNGLGKSLSAETFEGLTSLKELHLADCDIELSFVPLSESTDKTFEILPLASLKNLKRLNLQRNFIKNIPTNTLQSLDNLDSLDLSNNLIGSWNEPMFAEKSEVKNLNIGHNSINFITDGMMADFKTLRSLVIASNPFVCDCNSLEFINLVNNITETTQTSTEGTTAVEPRVYSSYGKSATSSDKSYRIIQTDGGFKTIDFRDDDLYYFTEYWGRGEEYVCSNKTVGNEVNQIPFDEVTCDSSDYKVIDNGATDDGQSDSDESSENTEAIIITVVIVCLVVITFGGVTYWKWWYIRYFAVLVKNATVLSFMSNTDEESLYDKIFIYDVFISYSDRDREWVLNNLLPNLESTSNIKVCLHERDFQVGIGILENIIACMDQSRSILLVISHHFLKSQWCQFELHLAQHRLLETRREELILLFLEDIPRAKRPKTLHYLMRTKTYIQWPQNTANTDAVKLFWKRLHNAILRNSSEMNKRYVSTV